MDALDTSPVPDYGARLRLDGRVFLVGGGGYGMGRQAAHALASQGARVLCVDIDGARAKSVADEVGGQACDADLRDGAQVVAAVDAAIAAFGQLNGIVNVVGESLWNPITRMSEHDWDWSIENNLRPAFLLLKHGAPALKTSGGGPITFVSSISGTTSAPFHSAYGAAKAALVQLARSAASELQPSNIRVNTVAPGPTATPRMLEAQGAVADGTLSGWGHTADIAGALLFLSSDLAAHVSGQTLEVDGALTAKYPLELPESFVAGMQD